MLLACDPRQRVDVTFPAADEMPAETRPTFTFRYVTVAEWFERQKLFREQNAATDDETTNAKLTAAVAVGLVDWRNLVTPTGEPVPYNGDAADLDKALGYAEKLVLYERSKDAVALGAAAKKKSALPPTSAPAPSAPAAVQASA